LSRATKKPSVFGSIIKQSTRFIPGVASNTNDGDGAAGDTDLASNGTKDSSEYTQEPCEARGVSLLDAVAAYTTEVSTDRSIANKHQDLHWRDPVLH